MANVVEAECGPGDIDFFESTSESDGSASERDDEEYSTVCSAAGIEYSDQAFLSRKRDRNILDAASANLADPKSEMESFLLFVTEDNLRTILRHTNRKVRDIRQDVRRVYL